MEVADCDLWLKSAWSIKTSSHHKSLVLASQVSLSPSWKPVSIVKVESVPQTAGREHGGEATLHDSEVPANSASGCLWKEKAVKSEVAHAIS